jgi:CheY-like chemotaxis protein
LILMDVHMPVMDGIEATRRIKSDPLGKQTSIVALTASAMDEDRRIVAESGADDFLAKPFREEELMEKMRTLLGVKFDSEEMSEAGDQSLAGEAALSAERLAQLPRELIHEIRKATSRGNKKLLDELILKVKEPESAAALKRLADKYDYDALTRVLEEAWRR